MADDLISVYAELHRRNAVPPEHRGTVDELVRRGVIKGGGKDDFSDFKNPEDAKRGRETVERYDPGVSDRMVQAASMGTLPNIMAGLETVTRSLPEQIARGEHIDLGRAYDENLRVHRARRQKMYEATGGEGLGAGTAIDVAGGLMTAPGMVMTQLPAARNALATTADLMKRGAAWGAGGAYLGTDGSKDPNAGLLDHIAERASNVPAGAIAGAVLGPVIGQAIPAGIGLVKNSLAAPVRTAKEMMRSGAPARAAEFEAAGVPTFGPALSDNVPGVNMLMGGLFGGPLRAGAQRSIEGVEQGVQAALGRTGAMRPVNDIGNEVQDTLRNAIVNRSRSVDDIAAMNRFELQDISGIGPGPNAPRTAPPVPRPQVEQWNPQRRVVTDDDVSAAMQQPPRMQTPVPKLMTVEDVILPPKLDRALSDARANATSAEMFLASNADQHQQMRQRIAQLTEQEAALPPVPRPRPVGSRYASQEEQAAQEAAEAAYDATAAQRRAITQEKRALEAQYAPFRQAEKALADADGIMSQANAYRSENLPRAQRAEAERVSREAEDNYALRMANARQSTRDDLERSADAQYVQDKTDPTRKTTFENQARNRAEAERVRLQREADTAYQAELETRQATAIPDRVGGRSRESYNTEFDAGYEASRRNTPPVQTNPLGLKDSAPPTATANLLDSIAMDYRKQGLLPGYKRGDVFAENGQVRPEILSIIDKLGGPGVAERMRALSDMRSKGSAQLGIEGLDKIRTAIGQALSDAKMKPIGGQLQGEGASLRARALFLARLYDALGDDVDRVVAASQGGTIASQQRMVLRASYKDFMTEIRAPLAKIFGEKTTPEQAVKLLTDAARGGDRGNLDLLNAYFRVAREKGDTVRASGALLTQMTDGGLEGFLASYRAMPREVRSMMFQGDMAPIGQRLDELAKVGGYLEKFVSTARPDQSVVDVAKRAASGQNVLMALTAYLHAPSAVVYAAGNAAASRVLASQSFRKWLERVPQTKTPVETRHHVQRLVKVVSAQVGMSDEAAREVVSMLLPDLKVKK